MMLKNPTFMCLNTYVCLKIVEMFIFKENQHFGGIHSMCCIKFFAKTYGAMAKL